MIRPTDVVFEYRRKKTQQKKEKKNSKGWDGNSGVGQASEFPFQPLLNTLAPITKSSPPSSSSRASHFYATAGSILILLSIGGFLLTYGPIIKVEIGYRLAQIFEKKQPAPRGSFGDLLNKSFLGEIEGVPDPNFSIIIPKIHAKAKIISNVDASDSLAYMEALKTGVAHAKGTELPGSSGNIYLFAHSTDNPINIIRYNAVFYLLKELEKGDEIEIFFGGVKHRYLVTDQKIIDPTDIEYLTPTNSENKEQLILQTCWPPGTSLKRLLVFAAKGT